MSIFDDAKRKLLEFKELIPLIIQDTFEQEEPTLRKMQTNQLYSGENSLGNKIVPKYAESTIKAKIWKKQPTDRVTLKDKGNFYQDIKFIPRPTMLGITAYTDNGISLQSSERYGADILGLQKENLEKFTKEFILPNIQKFAKDDGLTKS